MSNRKELRDARRKAEEAAWILSAVESLPRRVGQMVMWSNGVVWRRIGDDKWEPLHESDDYEPHPVYGHHPSAHVASTAGTWNPWTQIKQIPARTPKDTE